MTSIFKNVFLYLKNHKTPTKELVRCVWVNAEQSVEMNLTWLLSLSYLWYVHFVVVQNTWVESVVYSASCAFVLIKIAGIIRTINMERKSKI